MISRSLSFFALVAAFAAGCTDGSAAPAAGVPVVADAVVDVAFADLGSFADAVARAARAGLLPSASRALSQSGLEAAGVAAPVVVAVRAGGDVVIAARLQDATRFQAALALALPAGAHLERRFGAVDAVVADEGSDEGSGDVALVRAKDGVVVVVVSPADALAGATLVEALGSGAMTTTRRNPAPGSKTSIVAGKALLDDVSGLRSLSGTLSIDGDEVVVAVDAAVDGGLASLASGLDSKAPSWACAVEDGAAIAVRLPPASAQALTDLVAAPGGAADLDAFDGRLLIALYEPAAGTPVDADDKSTWASLVVAGAPRLGGAATLKQTFTDAAPGAVARQVGARSVLELVGSKPWRRVSAVVDESNEGSVFALGIGAPVVVDRVAVGSSCADAAGRLVVVDGRRALSVVRRAAPQLGLLEVLGVDPGMLPMGLRALQALDRLELSAVRGASHEGAENVAVTARIRLVKQ